MKKTSPRVIAAVTLIIGVLFLFQAVPYASISGSYPGYPGAWEGLTTNTIIEITLDRAVAMVGSAPDITYCVKKGELSGLDFVFTDVPCTVDVSADRKSITLYPQDILGENGMYAYRVENINFEDATSEQDYAGYFESGANPVPVMALQVDEADMCSDEGANLLTNQINYWCIRCHTDWVDLYPGVYGVCVLAP